MGTTPKTPYLAVDGIILENSKILMVKREIEPFSGYWTLIGGHVEYGEEPENAIKREIKEELGIEVKIKKLVGVYGNPKRDPRYHTVSIVYILKKISGEISLDWENKEYRYFSLDNLPEKIGFDHQKIINDLKESIKKHGL